MKKLIAVYNDSTRKYVDREYNILNTAGIPVEKRHLDDIDPFYINKAPCFVVEKHSKYGNRLTGKFNSGKVLEWANQINWE